MDVINDGHAVLQDELRGRNLNNDDYVTGQALGDQNVGLATNQFMLEPRTYGLSLGYNF